MTLPSLLCGWVDGWMDGWLLQVILRAPLVSILNSMERVVTSLHGEFLHRVMCMPWFENLCIPLLKLGYVFNILIFV